MVAAAVAFPVIITFLQRRCAVNMLIVCLMPSRIGFLHLDHGVLDGTVEHGCCIASPGGDGESPGGRVNVVAREHELVSFLFGGDNVGMIGLSKGLAAEVSDAGFSHAG